MFVHNDYAKCFHVVIQWTNKLVVMGCINFKDHALIKRQRVDEKMNVTSKMFKDEKNGVIVKISLCLLLEVVHIFEVLEFTII
jgi:acyl CoA:acetate/3-ketoacid CoA transferase alpha subunit